MTAWCSRSARRSSSTITPANIFVAGFIGSPAMNFLPATYNKSGKADAVLADGQKLRLPDGLAIADGASITVGVRPEHIQIVDDGPLEAEVEVVEPLGMSTQVYVRFAGQQICVFAIGRTAAKAGDRIRLAADPKALHLFDPAGGQSLLPQAS